ncbi:MAG: cell division topological specificity factor MinE [Eubacteriaceae bacterium]|nr:cell division topological specificity factor MinE [Eubacteriaceae bacterium]
MFNGNAQNPPSGTGSKDMAKERLKSILMRDRVDISRDMLESLKSELVATAKEYFVVKENGCEVYLTRMKKSALDENDTVLVCLVPISKSKTKIMV